MQKRSTTYIGKVSKFPDGELNSKILDLTAPVRSCRGNFIFFFFRHHGTLGTVRDSFFDSPTIQKNGNPKSYTMKTLMTRMDELSTRLPPIKT